MGHLKQQKLKEHAFLFLFLQYSFYVSPKWWETTRIIELVTFYSNGMTIWMAWCRMYAKKSEMYINSSISLDNILLTDARIMTIKKMAKAQETQGRVLLI